MALVESDGLYQGDDGPVVEFYSCETPETGVEIVLCSLTSTREGEGSVELFVWSPYRGD